MCLEDKGLMWVGGIPEYKVEGKDDEGRKEVEKRRKCTAQTRGGGQGKVTVPGWTALTDFSLAGGLF